MRSSGPWAAPGASWACCLLESVRPDVRALRVDGRSLFGGRRVRDTGAWPLRTAPTSPGTRLVRRGARRRGPWPRAAMSCSTARSTAQAVILGKGPDHPWDGGFAEITGPDLLHGRRWATPSPTGGPAARRRPAGCSTSADVAVVNHEGPAPDDATYHPTGLVFTFDPGSPRGVSAAGIDIVSLANNHIRNAGSGGCPADACGTSARSASAPSERAATPRAARRPTCLEPSGVRLCFLAYDAINTVVHAATTIRPGRRRAAPARRAQRHPPPATGWRGRHRGAAALGGRVHDPRPAAAAPLGTGHGSGRCGRRPRCPQPRRRAARVHRRRARRCTRWATSSSTCRASRRPRRASSSS